MTKHWYTLPITATSDEYSRFLCDLRDCPFCSSPAEFYDTGIIGCSVCGISAEESKYFQPSNKFELFFMVNKWNGFVRYDINGKPNKECFYEMFEI